MTKTNFDEILAKQSENLGRCALPGEDSTSPFSPAYCRSFSNCDVLKENACTKDCSITIFNKSNERISAFETFSFLRCNYEFANGLMKLSFLVGILLGSLVAGVFSDRFGRKPIFMAGLTTMAVIGLLSAFTENFWIFFIYRGLMGASDLAINLSPILCTEFLKPKHRKIVYLTLTVAFCFGQALVGIERYLITNYRYLLIVTALPSLLAISYFWLLPESPRWLVSQNRIEEAKAVMETAAKINGIVLPEDWHKELYLVEKEKRTGSLKSQVTELFQTREMLKRSVCNIFIWIVCSTSYYAVSLTPDALGVENRYLTFTLSAVVAIPIIFFLYATLDKFGRQKVSSTCFLLSGITMVIYDHLRGDFFQIFFVLLLDFQVFLRLIVCSTSYYAVSLTPDALGVENRYLTFTLSAVVAIPIIFFLYATLDKFGRQKVSSTCFLLSGITMVIYDHLRGLPTFVRLIVDIICRCSLNAAFTVIYIYLPEMFPTPVRNTSFGLFSAIGRVATISAMFLISNDKADIMWKILGVLCLVVVPVTMFLLPETAGADLPETVDDVEGGTKNKKKNGSRS